MFGNVLIVKAKALSTIVMWRYCVRCYSQNTVPVNIAHDVRGQNAGSVPRKVNYCISKSSSQPGQRLHSFHCEPVHHHSSPVRHGASTTWGWNLTRATTCYAWSPQHGHELEPKPALHPHCNPPAPPSHHHPLNRLPWNNMHFKINSAAQQQGSSERGPILGLSFINCSFSEPQKKSHVDNKLKRRRNRAMQKSQWNQPGLN